jgi:hypothetical protein
MPSVTSVGGKSVIVPSFIMDIDLEGDDAEDQVNANWREIQDAIAMAGQERVRTHRSRVGVCPAVSRQFGSYWIPTALLTEPTLPPTTMKTATNGAHDNTHVRQYLIRRTGISGQCRQRR